MCQIIVFFVWLKNWRSFKILNSAPIFRYANRLKEGFFKTELFWNICPILQ